MKALSITDPTSKEAATIPANEQWLHEPEMKQKLARAEKWLKENPPRETDLDELVAKYHARRTSD